MRKPLLFISLVILFSISNAQKISYLVSFPNIEHHEALITVTASSIRSGSAIFRMSRSSPGRYATHEFGKNVYDVKAFDKSGKAITINRIDGDVYEVPKQDGTVKVTYILYANYADGTYAGIDPTNVHFNMPAAFMWIKGYDNAPIDIKFDIPQDKQWTIATQLKPTDDPAAFTAPKGLQYFMDCPTKLGSLNWKEWDITNNNGRTYKFRLALEANTTDSLAAAFADKVKRITREEQAVYGEVPDYDYGTYTFIASINPWVHGDGMEHRNSTMISSSRNFDGSNGQLGVFAHEFFHCWNVKRIRPKTLEPFNFEKSDMSHELWFAEGFTQYYGELIVERAGYAQLDEFLGSMTGLINSKESTPGAKRFSPAEMSRGAVFVDAGVSVDRTNYPNMFTSYYPYGGAVAVALELELRINYHKTLDDYMTAVWNKFGKPYIPYDIPGLEAVLAQFTGDKKFAESFFAKYVNGHESYDYKSALEKAGLVLKKAAEGKVWMGAVRFSETNATINSNTTIGSPLYNAGLDIDDQLVQMDGKPIKKAIDINDILKDHKPGETVSIEYIHHNVSKTTSMTLAENPSFIVTTFEKEGQTPTDAMLQFRKAWLGTKVK